MFLHKTKGLTMVTKYGILIFYFVVSIGYSFAYKLNDDISIIHDRVLNLMLLPSKENISAIVQNATVYMQTLNSSCYWPDVYYHDKRLAHWRTADHLYRITTMLQALTVNGSALQNNPKLRANIHCALNVWLVHDWQAPNWYFNQIIVPMFTSGQLLMLGNNATSFENEKIKEISFRASWWKGAVGANLVWMLQVQLYRSLATNNVTGVEQGLTRMWQDVTVASSNKEGVQHDFSYHFHGAQLLSGAYGMAWLENILAFTICSAGTQYALDEQRLLTFVQFITKGSAWMIIGKEWDWNVMGRAVSRPDEEYYVLFYTKFIRLIANLVEDDAKIELINLANRLDSLSNASALIGNKHFFSSDYQIHRRINWTAGIHMQSTRTQPAECINDENKKAEHTGQGVLNLYTGNTYPYDNIFPVLDWQAINGITVEHDIPLEPCQGGTFSWKKLPFVGGVSDGEYGLALMDTDSHNLTAHRSWHFYDDAITALATNLTLRTPTTAWTTLASRLLPTGQITIGFFNSTVITLSDGNYSFLYVQNKTSNVQWIHVGDSDIAYLLQSQQQYATLGIQLGEKTGNYLDIGSFNATVTVRVLTIWIDHGVGPYTLDYNYMILPNVSLESIPSIIKQYNEEQVFGCISTNANFHGTMWPSLKRASFVLWDNVTNTFLCKSPLFEINIQLSDAGAYLYSENATSFTITASHPMRVGGNVKVAVDRIGSGEGCTASWLTNAGGTDVTLSLPSSSAYLGASVFLATKFANVVSPGGACVQIEYSPFSLDIERDEIGLLKTCRELGVAIVCYSPLGRGMLTRQIKSLDDFEENDYRRHWPRFSKENFPKNLQLVDQVTELAEKKGSTPGQLTLAWILALDHDFIPIPGSSKIKNLEENAAAAQIKLTKEEIQEIRQACEKADVVGERYPEAMSGGLFSDSAPKKN